MTTFLIIMLCIVAVALVFSFKQSEDALGDVPLDYRHNCDSKLDSPEQYSLLGRTDRDAYHAEHNAYKMDKPFTNGIDY